MLADNHCLDCGNTHIGLDDVVGSDLQRGGTERYPSRGKHYFDVFCPSCGRKQGLVIKRNHPVLFTIWPCSWNDEPCCNDGCEYCNGEYI
jgi:hypothetical protein